MNTLLDNHDEDGEIPPYWDFATDGSTATVTPIKRIERANVNGREVPILVGDIDSRERSAFLWPEGGLYGRFRDHIRFRPNKRIESGERVTIRRGDKRPSKTTEGRQVWEWNVVFHDAPELSQAAMFELDNDDEPDEDGPIPY